MERSSSPTNRKRTPAYLVFQLLFLTCLPSLLAQEKKAETDLDYGRYHRYDEMVQAIKRWKNRHPDLLACRSIGTTAGGRSLWFLTLTNRNTGLPEEKPAVYIDGNHHGNEVASGEVPLYLVDFLLRGYRRSSTIRHLLDTRTLYVLPRVNPDAAEWYFRGVEIRGAVIPGDDDRDGLRDEDPPDDLDGDGLVLRMRVPGRRGTIPEGIDDDGDGRYNEGAPTNGTDLNRDYPDIPGFGSRVRLTQPETRAVHKILATHPNIAEVQSFHTYGGILFRPFGSEPDSLIPAEDRAVYDLLAEGFTRYTGNRPSGRPYGRRGNIRGSLLDWAYGGMGIYAVTAELWRIPGEDTRERNSFFGGLEGIMGPVAETRWRRFNQNVLGGRAFIDWHPYDHPQLGPVQIGGWSPFFRRNPPPEFLAGVCRRATLFSIYQALSTARLIFGQVELISRSEKDPGIGFRRALRITFSNEGTFPTESRWARLRGQASPVTLELVGSGHRLSLDCGYLAGNEERTILFPLPDQIHGRLILVLRSRKAGTARHSIVLPEKSGFLDKPGGQK